MKPLPLQRRCDAAWHEMSPRPGGRHCAACDRNVVDLSVLTEPQARAVLAARGPAGLCVRQVVGPEGDLLLRPSPRLPQPRPAALAALALAVGVRPAIAHEPVCDRASSAQPADGTAPTPTQTFAQKTVIQFPDHPPQETEIFMGEAVEVPPDPIDVPSYLIQFEAGSAALTKEALNRLSWLEFSLAQADSPQRLWVSGHASPDEAAPVRLRALAQRRAEVVRDALIAQGVSPDRLVAASWGTTRPVASATTPEGRAQNRRVDFQIWEDAAAQATPTEEAP